MVSLPTTYMMTTLPGLGSSPPYCCWVSHQGGEGKLGRVYSVLNVTGGVWEEFGDVLSVTGDVWEGFGMY